MNVGLPHERLTQLISRFGSTAIESRQIAKRLHDLLPSRLAELKREHSRRPGGGGSRAEREALVDERFAKHVDEYVSIQSRSIEARIQYETHAMLFKARQSLRAFRR